MSSGSGSAHGTPVRTPTCPRSWKPKRPARPAICAISHGSRSRRSFPSNFVVSAKRRVSHGRLTPCPRTSVAAHTSARPSTNRSISSRRDASGIAPYRQATPPGWSWFNSPASPITARRLKATTTVPGPRPLMPRRPAQSSGAFRSKKRTSTWGKACRTSGNASTAPSSRMCRYSPPSMSRVHAEPRSSSSAHCTSSSTSVSPLAGAISAVQHTIGAPGLTRSSPVTRPTRSSPSSACRRRCASCASIRSGAAYTPRPCWTRKRSASCVLPELVGPRCAITVSGSTRRSGRRTVSSETGLRAGWDCRRRCRSLRLGRFAPPRATSGSLDLEEAAQRQARAHGAQQKTRAEQRECVEREGQRVHVGAFAAADVRQDRRQRDRLPEHEQDHGKRRPDEPADKTLEHEGAADEPVRRADELHHLDLTSSREDREPDRVRDQQRRGDDEQDDGDQEDERDDLRDRDHTLRRRVAPLHLVDGAPAVPTDVLADQRREQRLLRHHDVRVGERVARQAGLVELRERLPHLVLRLGLGDEGHVIHPRVVPQLHCDGLLLL